MKHAKTLAICLTISLTGILLFTACANPNPNPDRANALNPPPDDGAVTIAGDTATVSTLVVNLPVGAAEGATVNFRVTRTLFNGSTVDMTADSTCTGGCTGGNGTCTMSQAPCSAAPADCLVSDSDATNSPRTVTGINNDSVSTVEVSPPGPILLPWSGIQAFTCVATFTDTCTEDCAPGLFEIPGDCTGGGLVGNIYTAQGSGVCTDQVGATWMGVSDLTPTRLGPGDPPGIHDHYEIVASADVIEGQTIAYTVDDVDTMGNHYVLAGETVTASGNCTVSGGANSGSAPNLAPAAKTGTDTSGDLTDGPSDLAANEGAPTIPAGSYWVLKATTMSVTDFNVGTIPGGAAITQVTLKVVCGRNGSAGANPITYDLGAGPVSTGMICSDGTSGLYKPLQTFIIPGITTAAQINGLIIAYVNNAGGGGTRTALFDSVLLDVAYTVTSPVAIVANEIPCWPGGSCTLTTANIGGEPVAPKVVTVTNDDILIDVSVTPPGPVFLFPETTAAFACTATFSDSCTENCLPGTFKQTSCGTYALATGVYTAPPPPGGCANYIGAIWRGISDLTPAEVQIFFVEVPTYISCTVANITEGQASAYTCTDNLGANVTATTTVSGDCTGGAGALNANEKNCSAAAGSCAITQAGLTPWTVTVINDGDVQTGLVCTPDPLGEGVAGVTFSCTQTWNEGTCPVGNVTGTVTLSGLCSRASGTTLNVAEDDCNLANGSCTFTNNGFTDVSVVTNDDTLTSTLIAPVSGDTITQLGSQNMTLTRIWSEGACSPQNLTATAGWAVATGTCPTAGSITAGGVYTAPSVAANCTVLISTTTPVAGNSPVTITVNNCCIATSITCTVGSITEGAAGTAFTCTTNTGTDVTSTVTVGGASGCTKAGAGPWTISAPEANCSSAAGSCTITQIGLPPWPVTVNDDGDAIVSTLLTGLPASAADGAAIPFDVTRTWSESCIEELTLGSTCSGGCTGSNGLCFITVPCGSAHMACTVADTDATNSPQTIATQNGDADLDGYGDGCALGPDCNDANPNSWDTCGACLDSDGDTWWAGCNQYYSINGPDCNDGAPMVYPWAMEWCDGIDNQCPGNPGYDQIDEGCDGDGDGLLGELEILIGTDPFDPDTDDDGLNDGLEYNSLHTNPLDWDSDGDALPDGYEVSNQSGHTAGMDLNPLVAEGATADFDADGNLNVHEYWNGSSPWTINPVGAAGCYFWGDANGDGYIGPPDNSALTLLLKGATPSYNLVLPDTGETQDLNADTYYGPPDLALLAQFLKGTGIASMPSRPSGIEQISSGPASVKVGDTTHLTVGLRNTAGLFTPGFGVVFSIDPTSSGTATILGGDGADGDGHRYDFSGTVTISDPSNIVLRVDSAGEIKVNASTPQCGEVLNMGRYCDALNLAAPFVITGHE